MELRGEQLGRRAVRQANGEPQNVGDRPRRGQPVAVRHSDSNWGGVQRLSDRREAIHLAKLPELEVTGSRGLPANLLESLVGHVRPIAGRAIWGAEVIAAQALAGDVD